MRRTYFLPVILFSVLSYFNMLAQTGSIAGKVSDVVGKPLVNATISLGNTAYGTTTDGSGHYVLKKIPVGNYLLQFSYVGFHTIMKEVTVRENETSQLDFDTEEKVSVLDAIHITGIRTITGMGYLAETHDGIIFSGKKTEVLLIDSLDANTAQNNPRQVLGRVPGANYSETEGSGFPSNGIGFRGLNPTQSIETNTRQNGYNITADLFGYPESYYLPPLEAVDRIEVVRGASSLQYGPQFGGVINYIIKKGSTTKPLELTTQESTGSFGMFNSFNSLGGQSGKFNYYAFSQYQSTQGWRPNSDFRKLTGFARIEYRATDKIKFNLEYSILRNRIHMPGGFTDSLFAVDSRKSYRARNWLTSPWNILTASMQWRLTQHAILDIKSTFNSSARDLVWRNEDGGPQAKDDINPLTNDYVNRESQHEGFLSNTTEMRLLTNYTMGKMSNTLSTGVRFFNGKMRRQGGGKGTTGADFDFTLVTPGYEYDLDFTTTNFATYVENTFRPNAMLSITPGIRYEYINSSVKGFNPSDIDGQTIYSDQSKKRNILLAGISMQFNTSSTTNIYANWSQAYRPLDYSSLTPFGTIATVDPNLKDSKGCNTDVGFRGSIKNFLNFDIGGFYLKYDDRVGIIEKTDALGNQFPYRTNVANSIHKGFESYIEFNPIKAFTGYQQWSISFFNSLGLINAQYVSGEFKGNTVEYAPRYINRFGTNVVIRKFSTTLLLSDTGKSYGDAGNSIIPSHDAVAGMIPAYSVIDWSSTLKIKNYTLKLGLNNLADKRYFTKRTDEYPGPGIIPSIGRSFYAGFAAKF